MTSPTDFRAWLKRQRLERGLTQEELGERVGYAAQTITKIEGGKRRPSPQLARRLAEVLELAPEDYSAWMAAALTDAESEAATHETAKSHPISPRPPMPSSGLPTYLTPFVGRGREQAEIQALFGRPDCRLVTLLGPGGVGKTRLAIETVRYLGTFNDGIAFVSLASVVGSEAIVPAIGDALGVVFLGAGDLSAQLIAHLRDLHVLLVLDNFEHLLDPTGASIDFLEQLLTQTSRVTVLATSRERLRLAGEWVLELEGLAMPEPHTRKQPQIAPALALFAGHAERVDRAFRLTVENEQVVAAICQMVDGFPLGIELAAAWTRVLPLDAIALEITRSLNRAHLAPRTLPTRHHSLHAVVDHSWQLLNTAEREALGRLAVFHGGFSRDAALNVAGADLVVLASLVDKSLLRRSSGGRYDLHEIIRQYAHVRLDEHPDEAAATRTRHAHFYLHFLAERELLIKGTEQLRSVAEISAEIDNIRAAWRWAALYGPRDELAQAGETLQWFHEFRGWFREGTGLFAQAVAELRTALATEAPDSTVQQTLGCLLGNYGYLAMRFGALAQAQQALSESYDLLADSPNLVGLGRTLIHQGALARWSANYDEARRLLDKSLALTDVTGDRAVRAMTLTTASALFHATGEYSEAERLFRLALDEWCTLGNPRGRIWCIAACSGTLLTQSKYAEAEQLLRESLSLSYTSDDHYGMVMTLRCLGLAALEQGDGATAVYFLREALPVLQRAGNWEYMGLLNDLGAALWQAGDRSDSRRIFHEALALATATHADYEMLQAVVGIASHALADEAHRTVLRLARAVITDPASSNQIRQRAADLAQAACAHLSPEEVFQIESTGNAQTLAAILAELGLPARTR